MRKPTIPSSGQAAPFTRLKTLVRTNSQARDELMALTDELSAKDWIVLVNSRFSFGLSLEPALVTRFREYVRYLRSIDAQEDRLEMIREHYRELYPEETDEQINERGLRFFKQESIAIGDRAGFLSVLTAQTKAKFKEQELTLAYEKFAMESCALFLKWYADQKAREIAESNVSNADKITQLRQLYFADVDALKVELPE